MDDYHDKQFIQALMVHPPERSQEELDTIYGTLRGMEALCWLREPALRALCRTVRYQMCYANDILYCRGELATCWFILLSGSVFIDGSMFLPRSSFGKRSGGGGRRANECLILEPSEMIVIDYPDVQLMRPGQRSSFNAMNLEKLMALEQDEITICPSGRGPPPHPPSHRHLSYDGDPHHHIGQHHHGHPDTCLPDLVGSAIMRGARSRGSVGSSVRDGSDTSSAYSGSDTMCHSLQSSLEPDDVDLSGLTESAVDSDEEDLAESIESLAVRDAVRECLEKDPSERTEDDIKVLLEFTQRLRAFSDMTLAVRKAMCSAMVFAVVEEAGTVLMNHGEELDSWSVIINGHVEVTQLDGSVHELHLGDSFGITPTMEKLYHQGIMRSKVDDCQFVCIRQTDYYSILHQSEENIRRVEEDGVLVLVTEQRPIDAGNRKGNIVIKGTAERLMQQLVEVENNIDPTYVEDFLLTHRTFIDNPLTVANKLLQWFEDPSLRDRVTRVVLLWVNNHFTDFEMDPVMMNFLVQFEEGLEREKMAGQLRLLDFACATKARARTVTLTRPSRDEVLHFSILGGYERGFSIFISQVEKGSKAEDVGLKRGDQILEVNGQSFERMNRAKALEILRQTCHLSITVKSNLLAFKEMLMTPENSPRPRSRKPSDVRALTDPNTHLPLTSSFSSTMAAAAMKDPRTFFAEGTAAQFDYVYDLYDEAVKLKAEQKNKKPEEFLKLDKWYQQELPKKIKARGKDAHLTHEELCLCMKWKLSRGKFSPRLKDLIQMNTPRLCITETKKAFRALMKKEDLPSAIQALCNLKGVGPAMASTILTAGNPELCGFMADECLLAIPEIEGIDYTTKELLNFVEQLKAAANRLNKEGTEEKWNCHKVEMALWAHFVVAELKKELLDNMPGSANAASAPSSTQQPTENGDTQTQSPQKAKNGESNPEESNDSMDSAFANKENLTANTNGTSDAENSRASVMLNCEDTNDSVAVSEAPSEALSEAPSEPVSEAPSETISESDTRDASVAVPVSDTTDEPAQKKLKVDE